MSQSPPFPTSRPRRLRKSDALRRLVQETHFTSADLIHSIQLLPGERIKRYLRSDIPDKTRKRLGLPIPCAYTSDFLLEQIEDSLKAGIRSYLLIQADEAGKLKIDQLQQFHESVIIMDERINPSKSIRNSVNLIYRPFPRYSPAKDWKIKSGLPSKVQMKELVEHLAKLPFDMLDLSAYPKAWHKLLKQSLQKMGKIAFTPYLEFSDDNKNSISRSILFDLDNISKAKDCIAHFCTNDLLMLASSSTRSWLDFQNVCHEVLSSAKRAGALAILCEDALWLTNKLQSK